MQVLEEDTKNIGFSEEKRCALVETILFLESVPISASEIAKIAHISKDEATDALFSLRLKLGAEDSGIVLQETSGGWQLSPKNECWEILSERYGRKNDSRLSRAALETLAIIAYRQPITRHEIESIRGVPPDAMIRQLAERGLICEVGKKETPGHPVLFGTTGEFLRFFRLKSIAELPKLDEQDESRFRLAR